MNPRKLIKVDNQQKPAAVDKENVKPRQYLEKEVGKLSQQLMRTQQLYEEEIYNLQTAQEYAKTEIPLHLKEYLGARIEQLLNANIIDSGDDQHHQQQFDAAEAKKKSKEVGMQIRMMKKRAQDDEKIRRELHKVEKEKKNIIERVGKKSSILKSFVE